MIQPDLFIGPGERVAFAAPVAPGSETSRVAGHAIDKTRKRQKEVTRCLNWFARQSGPRTRNDLAAALYDGHLGSACGRVADLLTMGWVKEVGRIRKRATIMITETGRREYADARHSVVQESR